MSTTNTLQMRCIRLVIYYDFQWKLEIKNTTRQAINQIICSLNSMRQNLILWNIYLEHKSPISFKNISIFLFCFTLLTVLVLPQNLLSLSLSDLFFSKPKNASSTWKRSVGTASVHLLV